MSDPTKTQVGGDHYRKMKIQPEAFIWENGIGWHEGNAIVYLCRWKDKGGIEDLKKAIHTIELLIEHAKDGFEMPVYCHLEMRLPNGVPQIWSKTGTEKGEMPDYNPDKLESAGDGYRFLKKGEKLPSDAEMFCSVCRGWEKAGHHASVGPFTYRTQDPLPTNE